MNTKILSIALFSILILGCKKEGVVPANQTNPKMFPDDCKILTVGASRVDGDRPEYESYRYDLWKKLKDQGRTFDFIGTQNDPADYPSYMGESFDNDHEGYGGAVTKQIYKVIKQEVSGDLIPNVVLLGIGGNDLLESKPVDKAIKNINKTIDYLQQCNPNVVIFLDQITRGRSDIMTTEFTEELNRFNAEILKLASEQTSGTSYVIAVDMNSIWSDEFMADDVHFNAEGAENIASRYMEAMQQFFEN